MKTRWPIRILNFFGKVVWLVIFLCGIPQLLTSQNKPLYSYYNFFYGAKSISLANAFTSIADDLSAVFWNPAGIAGYKNPLIFINGRIDTLSYRYDIQENDFGTYQQQFNLDFNSTSKNIDFLSLSVPAVFWDIKWNFALSYYRYIPYNFSGEMQEVLKSEGENNFTKRNILNFSGKSGIDVLGFTVATLWSEYFSIGLTLQYFFNSGLMVYDYESEELVYTQEFTEQINGLNLIFGFLFKPDESLQVGFAYHTRLKRTFSSSFIYTETGSDQTEEQKSESDIYIPPQFSMGILMKPHKSFFLVYDFSKILWSRGSISSYYDQEGELPFPGRDGLLMDQVNVVNHRAGLEVNVPLKKVILFFRGGLSWERQLFVDALSNRIWLKALSLGFGIHLQPKVDLNVAYMHQYANWKEKAHFDSNSTVDTHFRNHIVVFSLTYRFGKIK
jgi:long-chain fatty acid transport protein